MAAKIFFIVALMIVAFSACVTSTQLCLDCPYGELALNRTMDTTK